MLFNMLQVLIPFLTAGGGGALGWYMYGSMNKPKPSKPKTESLADAVKHGYEAVDKMAKDIHNLYHPVGCKCVMCQLRADDGTPEETQDNYCMLPCFNCTVLTCPTHPDRKPASKGVSTVKNMHRPPGERVYTVNGQEVSREEYQEFNWTGKLPKKTQPEALKTDGRGRKWVLVTDIDNKDVAIRNLETQLNTLGRAYQELQLRFETLLKGEFTPDPQAVDRAEMQRLAQYAKDIATQREYAK
jgi:hypothetical protein